MTRRYAASSPTIWRMSRREPERFIQLSSRSRPVIFVSSVVICAMPVATVAKPARISSKPARISLPCSANPCRKLTTSRPRLRSEGMAPDGAALVTGAPQPPGVAGQVGAQSSSAPRIVAFTQVDGTGRSGPTVAYPMGRPTVSAWRRGLCVPGGRMCDSRRCWVVPARRLFSLSYGGLTSESGTRPRHRQPFVDRNLVSA